MFRSRKEALRSLGRLDDETSGKKAATKKKEEATKGKSKEAKSVGKSPKSPSKKNQKHAVGTAISKPFDGYDEPFDGQVVGFNDVTGYYSIHYEDGDEEEMTEAEVDKFAKKRAKKKKADDKSNKDMDAAPLFRVGAAVCKEVHNDEFDMNTPLNGTVSSIDVKSKVYTVTYENDSTEVLTEADVSDIFVPKFVRGKTKVMKGGKNGLVGVFDKTKRMYHVHLAGSDSTWMTEGEVQDLLEDEIHGKSKAKAQKKASMDTTDEEVSSSPDEAPRRRAKKVNYRIEDSSEEEFTDDDEKPKKKAKSTGNKKTKGTKTKGDSDGDDFCPGEESDDDELMDDAVPSSDEEVVIKKKSKKGAAAVPTSKPKKDDGETRVKMSDVDGIRKTLKNNPDYYKMSRAEIKATQSFLDPCGMEATDDIIDRLVGHQLDRISHLLSLALKGDALGSKVNPLVLGTACSGTDAPALALMLNQEQLEARGMGGLFKYEHVFSCEKEPYKQAYLARK